VSAGEQDRGPAANPGKVLYTARTHTTGGRENGVSRSSGGRLEARRMKIALPADLAIDAEVDLNLADGAYFLVTRLDVSLPGWNARSPGA
jgi:organic hydroperoxide reductase OsmC/OhrA